MLKILMIAIHKFENISNCSAYAILTYKLFTQKTGFSLFICKWQLTNTENSLLLLILPRSFGHSANRVIFKSEVNNENQIRRNNGTVCLQEEFVGV